jgi:hypothetical protein
MGDPARVQHKIDVLRRHCAEVDRDPNDVVMTTLDPLLHATSGPELGALVERLRPANRSAESYLASANGGTTAEHVDRFGRLGEIGVARSCISLIGNDGPERVEAFGQVIDSFR